jgi:hypothetical protein
LAKKQAQSNPIILKNKENAAPASWSARNGGAAAARKQGQGQPKQSVPSRAVFKNPFKNSAHNGVAKRSSSVPNNIKRNLNH